MKYRGVTGPEISASRWHSCAWAIRLVVSRIDYCNAVLTGVHNVHLRQLQRVLNAAARLIVRKRKYDSISATIPDALHWTVPGNMLAKFEVRYPLPNWNN